MIVALSKETLRAVRKHGRDGGELDKLSRKLYGISGTALLAKLIKGESGDRNEAVSSAGARGKGQFMPGTRQEVLRKFGVDPWKDSDSAAKAASLHLRGKLGHNVGLAGYNPGGGQSYVNYILNQKVGDVRQGGRAPAGAARAPKAPSGGGGTLTRTVTETTPGVDNSAVRQQLLQQYVLQRGRPDALLGLAQGLRGAQDVPEEVSTRTTLEQLPGEQRGQRVAPSSRSSTPSSGGPAAKAVSEAAKRLGVSEVGTSNRGKRLDTWQKKYGMLGQPWCGIFVGLALEKAGVKGIDSSVASVAAIEANAKAGTRGFKSWHSAKDARPGDALIPAAGKHVGLVERVDRKKGLIYTIEGNTSNGKVERRVRKMGEMYGVARPRFR